MMRTLLDFSIVVSALLFAAGAYDQRGVGSGYEYQNHSGCYQGEDVFHRSLFALVAPFLYQDKAEQHTAEVRKISDAGRPATEAQV